MMCGFADVRICRYENADLRVVIYYGQWTIVY